eukprot:15341916-Ditylum_brightwellii.AAC.1
MDACGAVELGRRVARGKLVNHGGKMKPSFGEPMSQFQILVGLLVVKMQVKTCVEEASGSVKLSGRSAYGEFYTVRTTEAGSQNSLRRCMLVD